MSAVEPHNLRLTPRARSGLWRDLIRRVEGHLQGVSGRPVTPDLDVTELRSLLHAFAFDESLDASEVLEWVASNMDRHQVHTAHPGYFGLFNPNPTTMGIMADTLVAAFNPQLAAWSHSPLACEIERHLVRQFASRFGFPDQTDGVFCGGGAEANHTALLTALVHGIPEFAREGVQGLRGRPVFYVGSQSHHSFVKAARFCGLGSGAVRRVPHDDRFRMDVRALRAMISADRSSGAIPTMVVATVGTTSGGLIDPVDEILPVCRENGVWLHVDAAWGGAAAFVGELRCHLGPIEAADSLTFDCHKWMSVPMGAGLYLTRHPQILNQTCHIETEYMPRDGRDLDIKEPYTHSMQWSRRFIGLKVFMSLAEAGWCGYASVIRHQTRMGRCLREMLAARGWILVNETPLPVVCFHSGRPQRSFAIAQMVNDSGEAWVSGTYLDPNTAVIRACITNFMTVEADLARLCDILEQARRRQPVD